MKAHMVLELGAFGAGVVSLRWRRQHPCEPHSVADADAHPSDAERDAHHLSECDRVHELCHFGLRKSEQHIE